MGNIKKLIRHFIRSAQTQDGYGFFKGIETAVKIAKSLGKNSVQKFRRYDIVPVQFFKCLHVLGLLGFKLIPNSGVPIEKAKEILELGGFLEGDAWSKFNKYELYFQAGTQQRVWDKIIDEVRFSKNAKIPRSQNIYYQSPTR